MPWSSTTRTVPGDGDLERLVVRPVLLGGLGHQADVGRAAHRRGVERSVLAAVVDGLAIELRVGVIRDHELCVLELAVGIPHLPRRADRGRHRGVDDHVAGNVEVGDPTVGVDHRQPRPVRVRRLDRGFDRGALIVRQRLDRLQQRAQAVVGVDARGFQRLAVLLEHAREIHPHRVAEDDRVRDPHHRRLQVHGEQDVALLGVLELPGEELLQGCAAHHGGVQHLARLHLDVLLEKGHVTVGTDELDPHRAGPVHSHRLLGRAKVAVAHRRDVRPGVRRPGAHRVWVLARVLLDRGGRAAVGVALAQHGVDGAALDLVVAGAHVSLVVVGGVLRVIGDVEPLALELVDRRLELWHGRADVRQLDDVGLGLERQLAQLGQRVGHLLAVVEAVGELGEDPPGERDVADLDLDPGGAGEGAQDRQQRRRGERGASSVRV